MSAGHLRQRGRSWELKYDIGCDPQTGRRITRYVTVHGSKADARRKLRELLTAVDEGRHVDKSNVTVGAFVAERVGLWQVSAATREHLQTVAKRLAPIAGIQIQQLTTRDVERWHGELRERGLSPSTARHAHRLLSRALADAVRHGRRLGTSPASNRCRNPEAGAPRSRS
jgi:hypothetical protein